MHSQHLVPRAKFRAFAVVPAAGQGARLGGDKLALPWGKGAVLEQTLAAWRACAVDALAVVIRPGDERLAALCRGAGVEPVIPPTPPPEMRDSVAAGLQWLLSHHEPQPHDVWLLAPADMPQLAPAIVAALLAAHNPQQPAVIKPTLAGRRGHPVLIPWPAAAALVNGPPEWTVKELLASWPQRELACDSLVSDPTAAFADLDTPADYARLRPRAGDA